jgi:hypothetical protein
MSVIDWSAVAMIFEVLAKPTRHSGSRFSRGVDSARGLTEVAASALPAGALDSTGDFDLARQPVYGTPGGFALGIPAAGLYGANALRPFMHRVQSRGLCT